MRGRRNGLCEIEGRRVVRAGAPGNRVLAGFGEHLKFMRRGPADLTGIGGNCSKLKAEPRKYACVCVVHRPVRLEHRIPVDVERIRVLHDELARAHDAESWPHLVSKLGLDVIKIERQLLVAADLLARDVGDGFFGCRLHDEIALMTVLQAKQLGPVLVPASGLLPQLRRLHHGHQKLDRARRVHFVAHDALDLAQDAQAQRHPGVDPRSEPLDHPGAKHELVAR